MAVYCNIIMLLASHHSHRFHSHSRTLCGDLIAGCCNKYHTGVLNQQKVMSHSSGGWEIQIKVAADVVPGKNTHPGLQMDACLLCPCVRERDHVTSYKGTKPIHEDFTLITSFFPKAPTPTTTTLGIRGLTYEFVWDMNIQFIAAGYILVHEAAEILESRLPQVNVKLALANENLEMPHNHSGETHRAVFLFPGYPSCFLHLFLRMTLLPSDYRLSGGRQELCCLHQAFEPANVIWLRSGFLSGEF